MQELVLKLVFLAVVCATKFDRKPDDLPPYTLDNYLRGTYSNRGWNGTWITGNTFTYRNSEGEVLEYNAETRTSDLFLNISAILAGYRGASYSLSPDLTYILIKYNSTSIYRYTTKAQYAIYDIANEIHYDVADKKVLSLVRWSTTGNHFSYVFDNNIYYVTSPETPESTIQITTDGVEGVIYNGVPDWVYEEEVYSTDSATWFSPDGSTVAFAFFNDTEVETYTYFKYGTPGTLESQYPQMFNLKYPKVGRTNPTATLKIVYLTDPNYTVATFQNLIPTSYLPSDYILFDVTWPTNSEVSVLVTNRVQNTSVLQRCSIETLQCRTENIFLEPNGWLDLSAPRYSSDGGAYVMILPQPEGNDFYNHLIYGTGGDLRRLTSGERIVTTIYGWDEENNLVYYGGTVEGYPSRQHVYTVNVDTSENKCLTCEYVVASGDYCLYAGASFSRNFTYFAKVCQGPDPYYITVQNINDENDAVIWQDNEQLRSQLANISNPVIKDIDVPLESGFVAQARMYLPPNLDENGSTKYPVVVQVYAGPDSVRITDAYSLGFRNYIVTDRKYIWIDIDGRGSGRRGNNIKFQMYHVLGTVEIEDQIAVTKYLQETYPYIDANNTGIWGWSYGGFAAAWVLVQDTEHVFNFALSVAPVTNFIYYDTIYTERYMGLPTEEDNLRGYNNSDITRHAEAFRDRNFLLIHGNADDNVHYQNSMLLEKALEYADVPFLQMNYPDENHSIGNVQPHLYHTIDRFFARSFGLPDPPRTDYVRSVEEEKTDEE